MKRNKLIYASLFTFIAFIVYSFADDDNTPLLTNNDDTFPLDPPFVKSIKVQKLPSATNGNNMIMRLAYQPDSRLSEELDIFLSPTAKVTFKDNGLFPDLVANDLVYSAYIDENIDLFLSSLQQKLDNLSVQGSYTKYLGHISVTSSNLPTFNFVGFNNNLEVDLPLALIDPIDCENSILKQHSLFITELSVVENPARTFNIVNGTGNPNGAWTFGALFKNMHKSTPNGPSLKEFLKSWVKHFITSKDQNNNNIYNGKINNQTVDSRSDAVIHLIEPWIKVARNHNTPALSTPTLTNNISNNYWENYWDDPLTDVDNLLKYAPFKLCAIVNRMDLRGNTGYSGNSPDNLGETRFIFSLIAPYDVDFLQPNSSTVHYITQAGQSPKHRDQVYSANAGIFGSSYTEGFIDWQGMNVIFEYGNVANDMCDLRNQAQQWLDLSDVQTNYPSFPLPATPTTTQLNQLEDYCAALQILTDKVTKNDASPGKPNGTAINRIRTNERLLKGPTGSWDNINWELRQFEIDPSLLLWRQVPVSNTPENSENFAQNISNSDAQGNSTSDYIRYSQTNTPHNLVDWSFAPSHKQAVYAGRHSLPSVFNNPNSNSTMRLAASAIINADFAHYWDFNNTYLINNKIVNYDEANDYDFEKQMRQQISLNTCQGCHAGETKTMFTQILPLGYGETAIYWDANTPDTKQGILDSRNNGMGGNKSFVPQNIGYSHRYDNINYQFDPSNPGATPAVDNYPKPSMELRSFPKVSAFLTGYTFSGKVGLESYNDDEDRTIANSEPFDQYADNIYGQGKYFVFDPSNFLQDDLDQNPNNTIDPQADINLLPLEKTYGYNDLQRRAEDLCAFVNAECSFTTLANNNNESRKKRNNYNKSLTLCIACKISQNILPYGSH